MEIPHRLLKLDKSSKSTERNNNYHRSVCNYPNEECDTDTDSRKQQLSALSNPESFPKFLPFIGRNHGGRDFKQNSPRGKDLDG